MFNFYVKIPNFNNSVYRLLRIDSEILLILSEILNENYCFLFDLISFNLYLT